MREPTPYELSKIATELAAIEAEVRPEVKMERLQQSTAAAWNMAYQNRDAFLHVSAMMSIWRTAAVILGLVALWLAFWR